MLTELTKLGWTCPYCACSASASEYLPICPPALLSSLDRGGAFLLVTEVTELQALFFGLAHFFPSSFVWKGRVAPA